MTCDSAWHAEHALADLAQHMAHWRAHRLSTAEPLPEALWERAVAFTAVYPVRGWPNASGSVASA